MSEPISAFAAYNANNKKTSNTKKNTNTEYGVSDKPTIGKKRKIVSPKLNAAKIKSVNSATSPKQNSTAANIKLAGNKNKGLNTGKDKTPVTTPVQIVKRTSIVTNKKNNSPKEIQGKKGNTVKKHVNSKTVDFNPKELDALVDELIVSPSKEQAFSAVQLEKKKKLEEYLVRELEKDDERDYNDDDCPSSTESASEYSNDDNGGNVISNGSSKSSINSAENKSNVAAKILGNKRRNNEKSNSKVNENVTTIKSKKSKMYEESNKLQKKGALVNNNNVADAGTKPGDAKIKTEPASPPLHVIKMNSVHEGLKLFRWLISPITVEEFYSKYWEKSPCVISRSQEQFFSHLISFEAIDQMLLKHHVEYTKNIDITSYTNGVRSTLNPDGRAMPPTVWAHYSQGCSIRLLNPQTFLQNIYTLNTTMQEYFHCFVGANAYLTPPNSQGFAPHYDDIEAFVLQIEGRKRWKLYSPRNDTEILPRYSSHNFSQSEIGKPIKEVVLKPGDVLYFPRGTIHQACTEPGYHSLHITLSVYQKQSYADLLEKMLPLILQRSIASNVNLRRGLPLNLWQNAGYVYRNTNTSERNEIVHSLSTLLQECVKNTNLTTVMDDAVDQLAKRFQHEALPPEILPSERLRTVYGSRSRTNERGECLCDYEIDLQTSVRLLRANILRLVKEEENIFVYYYLDNSKEYCKYEQNFIEIKPEESECVELLMKSYPNYINVSQFPLEDDDRKIDVVSALWEQGLLMMEKPIK